MDKFKAGIVQFDVKKGAVDSNLEKALEGISRLGDEGTQLVLLPEMWSCGFDYGHLEEHALETPEILEKIGGIARAKEMVVTGSLPETANGKIYNTLYVVDKDGSVAGTYRKVHLFSFAGEHEHFGAGSRAVVCNTKVGRIGLMICYDLRFPELCRCLALKGADIIVIPAQWPRARGDHWDLLLRGRALENQVFIMGANRCGRDENLDFPGLSQIVSPQGQILCRVEDEEALISAEIDYGEKEEFRKKIPCLRERVPEVYGMLSES